MPTSDAEGFTCGPGWTHEDDPKYTGDPETDRALFLAKALEFSPARAGTQLPENKRASEIEAKLRMNVEQYSVRDRRIGFPFGLVFMTLVGILAVGAALGYVWYRIFGW